MTTVIVRKSDVENTLGKFCVFNGIKKKSSIINCEGAINLVFFSIAGVSSPDHENDEYFLGELLESLEFTINETTMNFADFTLAYQSGDSIHLQSAETINPIVPNGYSWIAPFDFSLQNKTDDPIKMKISLPSMYKGKAIFVTTEPNNTSIINKGIEISFCLSSTPLYQK